MRKQTRRNIPPYQDYAWIVQQMACSFRNQKQDKEEKICKKEKKEKPTNSPIRKLRIYIIA